MSSAEIRSILIGSTEVPKLLLGDNKSHLFIDLNITSDSTDVKEKIVNAKFSDIEVFLEVQTQANHSNVTNLVINTQIFSVEYQIFVASVLVIFATGNLLMASAPLMSRQLRKARATVLLTFLSVVDLLSCIGAIAENIHYAQNPHLDYQPQLKCFFIRLPYHTFSFWAPTILLLIGLERITLLKFPLFYKFHVRKRNLVALAVGTLIVPILILAISYGVLKERPKRIPMCHNTFAMQVEIADISTFYFSSIYGLIAVIYVIFGVLMRQRYHKIATGTTLTQFKPTASVKTFTIANNSSIDSTTENANVGTPTKASKYSNSKSLMKALILVTCIYILTWLISLIVLFFTIGLTVDSPEELAVVLYVSPLLYLNHGCNFFVFAWASKSYFDAYHKIFVKLFSVCQLKKMAD